MASTANKKYVYRWGAGKAEGNKSMKNFLGGKGANLHEMSAKGVRVPPGFTITAELCQIYADTGKLPDDLWPQVDAGLEHLQGLMKAPFGSGRGILGQSAPPSGDGVLLVSVRSGAAISMPGMMDTVLNLGLNDAVAEKLIKATGNPRFVYDSYRRYIDMYGDVVMGVPHEKFEEAIAAAKEAAGVNLDVQLNADHLKALVGRYKAIYAEHIGAPFPDDAYEALKGAIKAVFKSWSSPRAVVYRKINKVSPTIIGTAVNVQCMVFGNMGADSGTGVLFTRNPSTGEDVLYGEFLQDAQGEDVVAGIRTPQPIAQLKALNPAVYDELLTTVKSLEAGMGDMQDVEFTIMRGVLYILQTRDGKRTGAAAIKIATDMVAAGTASKETAIGKMINCAHIDQLLHPQIKAKSADYKSLVLGKGIPASPGAAVGRIVFTAEDAEAWRERGEAVILVRSETSAEDVAGMHAAEGILTTHGGMTSHAAVVARGWGKPCVCGCGDVAMSAHGKTLTSKLTGEVFHEGDWLSLNASTGEVVKGKLELTPPDVSPLFLQVLRWAAELAPITVHANADSPAEVEQAVGFGAAGIGLCRTEHMFWGEPRIRYMREVILAQSVPEREAALDKLFPFQRDDFKGMFIAAASKPWGEGGKLAKAVPMTIRLLDPPLHEYLPRDAHSIQVVAEDMGVSEAKLNAIMKSMKESNPMIGHRGCRLQITHPEIPRMQARAIVDAACQAYKEGYPVDVEIMVPLVGTRAELDFVRAVVADEAAKVQAAHGTAIPVKIGTMVETPRAALVAHEIVKSADFFSIGSNDMTQTTFGYSRDDAPKFLPRYIDARILPDDPFQTLDVEGVGALVKMTIDKARAEKPGFSVGICGEVGGEERSIHFLYNAGISYVSCSPFRIPVAWFAAAQAGLAAKGKKDATKDI